MRGTGQPLVAAGRLLEAPVGAGPGPPWLWAWWAAPASLT